MSKFAIIVAIERSVVMLKKVSIVMLFMIIFVTGCLGSKEKSDPVGNGSNGEVVVPPPKPKLKIVNEDSKDRPIAIMIDNHPNARSSHTGLQEAYLTYEILVEGGFTRYLALYRDTDTSLIGPVRSARHYYLDYALENDAIYGHFGWSPKAQSDISSLKINNINGLVSSAYFRDNTLYAPHNAFTSIENLKKAATESNYIRDSKNDLLLDYSIETLDFSSSENAQTANKVTLLYSNLVTTSYTYDTDEEVYHRVVNGSAHTDRKTKEQYTVKNIIAYQINTVLLDSSGRIDLKNIGKGNGYFISNGISIPITWEKTSRSTPTKYYDLEGKPLVVNDGNTYIQILPTSGKITIME